VFVCPLARILLNELFFDICRVYQLLALYNASRNKFKFQISTLSHEDGLINVGHRASPDIINVWISLCPVLFPMSVATTYREYSPFSNGQIFKVFVG